MIKIIFIFIAMTFSLNTFAQTHDEYYEKGKKYVLLKKEADSFLSGYAMFSKKLQKCIPHTFNYYNPLINREGMYEIFGKKSNGKCILYINYNNVREFKCDLSNDNIQSILNGRISLIRNKSGFGELSEEEKSVYFNKNVCKRNILKTKNKEVSLEELKKNVDNPELLKFLETFKSKN